MNINPIKDTSFDEIKIQKREAVETERYEEERRRSWIQFWVPVVVSILALLIAFASLSIDVIQLKQSNVNPNLQHQSNQ